MHIHNNAKPMSGRTDAAQIEAVCCFDNQNLHWEKWTDEERTQRHFALGIVLTKFVICNFTRDPIYHLKALIISFG